MSEASEKQLERYTPPIPDGMVTLPPRVWTAADAANAVRVLNDAANNQRVGPPIDVPIRIIHLRIRG